MTTAPHPPLRIIRLPEVCRRVGLSRASIYNKLNSKHKDFDSSFPKQIPLGARAVGFCEQELIAWMQVRLKLAH